MSTIFKPVNSFALLAAIGLWCLGVAATPAYAQISYTTPGNLKAEARKNKKEAATYEAEHKESHLNVADFTYKRGQSGRKAVAVEEIPTEFDHDRDINVLWELPKKEVKKKKKLLKRKSREDKSLK